ncbi:phage regulatory CII family protein [Denitrificimonas caeni]|uniref:phage regulatory CII family protein n=1 Tax=Denitrificimonas caeni TaxID=521720 RepID=UPI0019630467|nr:phage regulatory CII family protein [Denitrificimonas caeni]
MSRKDLLPVENVQLNVRQALYRASRDYPGGQFALALTLGISADDLCKRVNPKDIRPIRPELIEEIVEATRDQRLLAALVRPAGAMAFVPTVVSTGDASLKSVAALLDEVGAYVRSLADGSADDAWKAHEVAELRYHAERLIGQVLGIVAGAELAVEVNHG